MTQEPEYNYEKYLRLIVKNKYLFILITLVVSTAVTVYCYTLPRLYESQCTVFIKRNVISDVVKDIAWAPSSEDKSKLLTYEMRSRPLLLKVIKDLNLNVSNMSKEQLESLIKKLQLRTEIRVKDGEGLFSVSFQDENAVLARDYLNALVHRYAAENNSSHKKDSYVASVFLSEQVKAVKERFDAAEKKLTDFKSANGNFLALNETQVQADIDSAAQIIQDNKIKRGQLESQLRLLRQEDPLQQKLLLLQKKLDELRSVYTDNYPDTIAVKNEMDFVKEQIRNRQKNNNPRGLETSDITKIVSDLKVLDEVDKSQQQIMARKKALLWNMPEVRRGYDELERERNNQKQIYEQFLVRKGQSEISRQAEVQEKESTFRIVDPALVPSTPTSPNRPRMILFGIIGGIVVSFGLLLLKDNLDTSVRDIESLRTFRVPVLAIIPQIQDPQFQIASRKKDLCFFSAATLHFLVIVALLIKESFQLSIK